MWQKDMMNTELEQSIQLKRAIEMRERNIDKMQDDYQSLQGVGRNYDIQMARQR